MHNGKIGFQKMASSECFKMEKNQEKVIVFTNETFKKENVENNDSK